MAEKAKHVNLETQLNINHFEKLMAMFQEHRNEDGSTGFDIDKVCETGENASSHSLTSSSRRVVSRSIW